MIHRSDAPRVHGRWTAPWFAGEPRLTQLFGRAPTLEALVSKAPEIHVDPGWPALLESEPDAPPPSDDSLLVLAGQQPVLGGGPALVIHKAVTAIALADELASRLDRPVIPVFLLATQDADTSEVDHLDLLDSALRLQRLRCPVHPQQEMFARARWDRAGMQRVREELARHSPAAATQLGRALGVCGDDAPLADHVLELLRATLGPLGLRFVQAHRLASAGEPVLDRALADPAAHGACLAAGAERLRAVDLSVAFDAADPRPLVLESRGGRRKRLQADDADARARLAADPGAFSPHAALRPIVQARALPVLAQVAGPSEIVYLGQARELHALHGVTAPLLVPRMEATRLSRAQFDALAPDFQLTPDDDAFRASSEATLASARVFAAELRRADARLATELDRWERRLQRDLDRLSARPFWLGSQRGSMSQVLRPRGRAQDAVLAWLPDAWAAGDPGAWAAKLVGMARGHEAPVHLFHDLPEL